MTVSITRHQTRACVQFTIEDDIMVESDEDFGVELSTTSAFATVRDGRSMATVTIEDNDEREFPTQLTDVPTLH